MSGSKRSVEFEKAVTAADKAFKETEASAWKAVAPARKAYEHRMMAAREARDEAIALAQKCEAIDWSAAQEEGRSVGFIVAIVAIAMGVFVGLLLLFFMVVIV